MQKYYSSFLNLSSSNNGIQVKKKKLKKNISKNVRIKVDLANKKFTLLSSANQYVRNTSLVKFCYADINCRPKIKWREEDRENTFFKNMEDLNRLIEEDL